MRGTNSHRRYRASFAVPFNATLEHAPENYGTISLNGSKPLKRVFLGFLHDENGATAIEYGLIAAGISLAIIAAVNGLGTALRTKFTAINTSLK